MASITTWTRIEPRTRDAAMAGALEARLADPLWLLARQWQLGEFRGEDAGSPVQARLRGTSAPVTRWLPGQPGAGSNGRSLAPVAEPLEEVVENDGAVAPRRAGAYVAAEAGLAFMRLLDDAGLANKYGAAYLEAYPIKPPSAAQRSSLDGSVLRLLSVVARRAPHGGRMYEELNKGLRARIPRLPKLPRIGTGADRTAITELALKWLSWYDDVLAPAGAAKAAWVPERLDYEFALGARSSSGQIALTAPDHPGGDLDWYSFDVDPGATLGAGRDPAPVDEVRTIVPAPIRYSGMPARRFWEYEDETTNFGAVDAAADDLGRLLLVEFALVYGNDFFLLPLDLDVGSLWQTRSLVVTDTFGERTLIKSARELDGPAGPWTMYVLSEERRNGTAGRGAADGLFFLPPVLGPGSQSDQVEDVLFIRDEMANIAWAVERTAKGPAGTPVDRLEAWQLQRHREEQAAEEAEPGSTAPKAGMLAYDIESEVPDHWFPLLPVATAPGSIALRLGELTAQPAGNEPLGRILAPYNGSVLIREEEVPRAGARVTRSYRYARWIDGSTHLWVGRRKRTGRGEGSSGLRFDTADPS